jgi:energy-coupling factor transporter ATP-binding protein EcfA2
MDDTLLAEIIERLSDDDIDSQVDLLVLAACQGPEDLAQALGEDYERPAMPSAAAGLAESPGAYLGSITVEGFRGIGESATLPLEPGPGLTLVLGRNGSGKSSFAEAVEVLLTGDNRRWADRAAIWREGWRNLHHADSTAIHAQFLVEGQGETTVARVWTLDGDITTGTATVQSKGSKVTALADLRWEEALAAYRPFLSYNELGSLLDEGPSVLYDALASILGLEDLVEAERLLSAERRDREKRLKDVKSELVRHLRLLKESDDERATTLDEALGGKHWDLDTAEQTLVGESDAAGEQELRALRALSTLEPPLSDDDATDLVSDLRSAVSRHEEIMASAAGAAQETLSLVRGALALHKHQGDGDCPVCGTPDALSGAWQKTAEQRLSELEARATEATTAQNETDRLRARLRRVFERPPPPLQRAAEVGIEADVAMEAWERWGAETEQATLAELAERIEAHAQDLIAAVALVRESARHLLEEREDAWRPIAVPLTAWVKEARDASLGAEKVRALKDAESWFRGASDAIRAQRFEPIATAAIAIWNELRMQSNVELKSVLLTGSKTQRRVELEVTVDDVEGAALGVMSQGELHSLALSLFFPRATLPQSPFRFLVIDDPVQSMDPARVDGLARVLETQAKTRQVVVFTHDDRLAQSIRQLSIDATILEVTRRQGSVVDVRNRIDAIWRYLQDAFVLLDTENLPEGVAERVVPGLCRLALEAAFTLAYRRDRLREGALHQDIEEAIEAAATTNKKAALGLYGDVSRAGDVMSRLNKIGHWAGTAFKAAKEGTHGGYEGNLGRLVRDTNKLAKELVAEKP